MHLVYHSTSIDDGFTYYEANLEGAYYLIRTGKVLEVVNERLGSYAAQVLAAIAYHGHIMISELEALPELRIEKNVHPVDGANAKIEDDEAELPTNGVGSNGHVDHDQDDHTSTHPRLHSALNYLAGHGYICRVKETHLQSPADNELEAEREAILWASGSDSLGKKKTNEIEEKKKEILSQRLDADLSRDMKAFAHPPFARARKENGNPSNPNKRRRIDSDDESENDEDPWGDGSDDHTSLQVSFTFLHLINLPLPFDIPRLSLR